MWPWEHLAVGYILASLLWRARGRVPNGATALAVAVGTQFPDLVDKPLAWGVGVLERGISVAHSVFVAVPLSLLAIGLARRYGDESDLRITLGSALGYLSHIPADAVYPVLYGDRFRVDSFLWPIATPPGDPEGGFVAKIPGFLAQSLALVTGPRGALFLALEALLVGTALVLWVRDGAPGVPRPRSDRPQPSDR